MADTNPWAADDERKRALNDLVSRVAGQADTLSADKVSLGKELLRYEFLGKQERLRAVRLAIGAVALMALLGWHGELLVRLLRPAPTNATAHIVALAEGPSGATALQACSKALAATADAASAASGATPAASAAPGQVAPFRLPHGMRQRLQEDCANLMGR